MEPSPRLRAPLVVAPAAALGDSADVLWTVIGPSSDAHFDKKAGAAELNQLVEGKVHRLKTIGQHEEWQDALTTLKSILQQFHSDYARGWFSEQRQKIEVAQSRLDETGRAVGRLDQQLLDLQTELDRAAEQLESAKLTLAEQSRQRGLLEQFERSYGCHLEEWRRDIGVCRDRAAVLRKQQEELRKQAQDWETKSRESRSQAQAAFLRGSQLDVDRS
jgi:chromosome segregation ATPase